MTWKEEFIDFILTYKQWNWICDRLDKLERKVKALEKKRT